MFKLVLTILLILVLYRYLTRENLLSDYDTRTRFLAVKSQLGTLPRNCTQGEGPRCYHFRPPFPNDTSISPVENFKNPLKSHTQYEGFGNPLKSHTQYEGFGNPLKPLHSVFREDMKDLSIGGLTKSLYGGN